MDVLISETRVKKKMTKFEQNIEKSYKKDFQKAKQFFLNHEYKKAEKLLLKCYKYYKNKNQLKMAYEALEKYIIVLIRIGVNQRALPRLNELLDFSNRTDNKQYKALVYGLKGIIYKNMGDINKSIEYTKNAIEFLEPREIETARDQVKLLSDIAFYFQRVRIGKGFNLRRNGTELSRRVKELKKSHPYFFESKGNGLVYPSRLAVDAGNLILSYDRSKRSFSQLKIGDYTIKII